MDNKKSPDISKENIVKTNTQSKNLKDSNFFGLMINARSSQDVYKEKGNNIFDKSQRGAQIECKNIEGKQKNYTNNYSSNVINYHMSQKSQKSLSDIKNLRSKNVKKNDNFEEISKQKSEKNQFYNENSFNAKNNSSDEQSMNLSISEIYENTDINLSFSNKSMEFTSNTALKDYSSILREFPISQSVLDQDFIISERSFDQFSYDSAILNQGMMQQDSESSNPNQYKNHKDIIDIENSILRELDESFQGNKYKMDYKNDYKSNIDEQNMVRVVDINSLKRAYPLYIEEDDQYSIINLNYNTKKIRHDYIQNDDNFYNNLIDIEQSNNSMAIQSNINKTDHLECSQRTNLFNLDSQKD